MERRLTHSTTTSEQTEFAMVSPNSVNDGWLHKTILFFNSPTEWNVWQVVMMGMLGNGIACGIWWLLVQSPRMVLGVFLFLLLFFLVDTAVLLTLVRQRLSYGPWKPQLFALTVPRTLTAAILALLAVPLHNRLAFGIMLTLQVVALLALIWASFVEVHRLKLTEYLMFTDLLPPGVPPINVLHITDLHIERWTKREDKVLEIARSVDADLIVISGDYVNTSYNEDPETHRLVRQLLSQLSAPYGVYATMGTPPVDLRDQVAPILQGLDNITLLRHDWVEVALENGRSLAVMGMDCTHHLPTDRANLARLASRVPHHLPKLFVYHSPELMPEAAQHGLDFYVCGHTHGGQVRLPIIGPLLTSSQLGRRFVMGHYRLGRTNLYVSRGIGLEGMSAPRVRLLCPPEMTKFTLMPSGRTLL